MPLYFVMLWVNFQEMQLPIVKSLPLQHDLFYFWTILLELRDFLISVPKWFDGADTVFTFVTKFMFSVIIQFLV